MSSQPQGRDEALKHRTLADDPHWYKDAIIYQLHIKAYQDSSGDGIGDLAGLTRRLDYIASLGVTAVWLLPFYPSPMSSANLSGWGHGGSAYRLVGRSVALFRLPRAE